MRYALLLFALSLGLLACQPEALPQNCEVEKISQLTIHNTVDVPVGIWLDSTFQAELNPADETTLEVTAGIYHLYVEETGDAPTTYYWETNLQLFSCQERKFSLTR